MAESVRLQLRLVRELAEEPLTRGERRELRAEAREEVEQLDTRAERRTFRENLELLINVASKGGPAVETAGENLVVNALYAVSTPAQRDGSPFFEALERADRIDGVSPHGAVVTRDDARALVALFGARPRDADFDPDEARRRDVRTVVEELEDEFRFFERDLAAVLSVADIYAAGLEANWDDMTVRQRRGALEHFTEGQPLRAATGDAFLGEPDLGAVIARARDNSGVERIDLDAINAQIAALADSASVWTLIDIAASVDGL